MNQIQFANPEFFYLFLVFVPLLAYYIWRGNKKYASIQMSSIAALQGRKGTWKIYMRHTPFVLRLLVIALVIVVLSRPQSQRKWQDESTEGIDIVMALDISSSMLAKDFIPNRLVAAKATAAEFIAGRPLDNIGLVVFSGESFTQCPMTTDHAVLQNLFNEVECGMIEDGTAIGMGLATAVNRLRESKAKSKVIVLLTDGVNNSGDIAPITAADIAKNFGVRVYTIGVGTDGFAPYPVQTPFGMQYQDMKVDLDEDMLTQVANVTGGKYFRAKDNKKLKSIYQEIDKMEKTILNIKQYRTKQEEYLWYVIAALILLFVEQLLRYTLFKVVP